MVMAMRVRELRMFWKQNCKPIYGFCEEFQLFPSISAPMDSVEKPILNSPQTAPTSTYKIDRFLGWYYGMLRQRNGDNDPPRIVIGKDACRSSYMFEYVPEAMQAAGILGDVCRYNIFSCHGLYPSLENVKEGIATT